MFQIWSLYTLYVREHRGYRKSISMMYKVQVCSRFEASANVQTIWRPRLCQTYNEGGIEPDTNLPYIYDGWGVVGLSGKGFHVPFAPKQITFQLGSPFGPKSLP